MSKLCKISNRFKKLLLISFKNTIIFINLIVKNLRKKIKYFNNIYIEILF